MTGSSRLFFRSFVAAGLAVVNTGCSMLPSSNNTLGAKANTSTGKSRFAFFQGSSTQVTSTSTPGGSDFMTSNKLKDPVRVHMAYAMWNEQEGNSMEARSSYNIILEKSPKNIDAMLGLARLDIASSRMQDAEQRLQKAQKLSPKSAQVAVAYGQFHMARNDLPQALEQMKLARQLSPYDTSCAYHLGFVQAKMGDTEGALANFTEAVGPAEAQYNLGYILHEQGNIIAAEIHLQKAIALKPDLPQAQSLLLTVRQKRHGGKLQIARGPSLNSPSPASTGVQPASYTVPAGPSPVTASGPFGPH